MVWNHALDGDEGSLAKVRREATATLWAMLAIAVFTMAAMIWSALDARSSGERDDWPQSMFGFLAIFFMLALYNSERYRRRKLEERIRALEEKA